MTPTTTTPLPPPRRKRGVRGVPGAPLPTPWTLPGLPFTHYRATYSQGRITIQDSRQAEALWHNGYFGQGSVAGRSGRTRGGKKWRLVEAEGLRSVKWFKEVHEARRRREGMGGVEEREEEVEEGGEEVVEQEVVKDLDRRKEEEEEVNVKNKATMEELKKMIVNIIKEQKPGEKRGAKSDAMEEESHQNKEKDCKHPKEEEEEKKGKENNTSMQNLPITTQTENNDKYMTENHKEDMISDGEELNRQPNGRAEQKEEMISDGEELNRQPNGRDEQKEEMIRDGQELNRQPNGRAEQKEEMISDGEELNRQPNGRDEQKEEMISDGEELNRQPNGRDEQKEEMISDGEELNGQPNGRDEEKEEMISEEPWRTVLTVPTDQEGGNHTTTAYLSLLPEEALFLSYALGCLVLTHEDPPATTEPKKRPLQQQDAHEMTIDEMWRIFTQDDPAFPIKYAAFHHFRSQGWVVKGGLKYGVDYVLYPVGPPFYHSQYAVRVHSVWGDTLTPDHTLPGHALQWTTLATTERMANHVNKAPLMCLVLRPRSLTLQRLTRIECLKEMKVQEVLVARWKPSDASG